MSNARTIEWASVAEWVAENEQQIRDVMKFEGLKGAMVEVLRLAPEQPELAALREELATFDEGMREIAFVLGAGGYNAESLSASQLVEKVKWGLEHHASVQEQRLTVAEQRNAELTNELSEARALLDHARVVMMSDIPGTIRVKRQIEIYLKPTESGASE